MNVIIIVLLYLVHLINTRIVDKYDKLRKKVFDQEACDYLGGDVKLNEEEKKFNETLMKLKNEELNQSLYDSEKFNFSRHFFTYREYIEDSKVYSLIKRMPKGALLHLHGTLLMNEDYLLSLTYLYDDILYVCYTKDKISFQFSLKTPVKPCDVDWILIAKKRRGDDVDVKSLDLDMKKRFTLVSTDENDIKLDLDKVWLKFRVVNSVIKTLITYRPLREKFIYDSLKRLYDDNIMYAEIRTGLHNLYELNGTEHEPEYIAKLHRTVLRTFKKDYPDFIGIKFIITSRRNADDAYIKDAIDIAKRMKADCSDMIAGFDLVGQEDKGRPLIELIPLLLEAKKDLSLYLHAGETKWSGTATDENLIDAVLLGSKRLGHAYALPKHPALITMVKQQDIALEVNVLSNQVLALVGDVRNHPLASFLALGLPVVLSSDDPGVWGAEPLSHDFYLAFVAVASKHADLRLLKKLALNSIKYSALGSRRKKMLYEDFEKRWAIFISKGLAVENKDQDCGNSKAPPRLRLEIGSSSSTSDESR